MHEWAENLGDSFQHSVIILFLLLWWEEDKTKHEGTICKPFEKMYFMGWTAEFRAEEQHLNKIKYILVPFIRLQLSVGTSWVNNWDEVHVTLCLSSRTGRQPFNKAASITPHQENNVLLDLINKNYFLPLLCVGGCMWVLCTLYMFTDVQNLVCSSEILFYL